MTSLDASLEDPELAIGEVARRSGVAASSIRYYESIGLLPEPLRVSGQRRYGPEVLGRLAFIGMAKSAGFKLREIAGLTGKVDETGDMATAMRSVSRRKLPEIEALLERTAAIKGWLELASECACESPAECSLFPEAGEGPPDLDSALRLVRVEGRDCRLPS
jgi:DNA-binding transcriptional MerR regulator